MIKQILFYLWGEKKRRKGKHIERKEVAILNCLKQYFYFNLYFIYTKVD